MKTFAVIAPKPANHCEGMTADDLRDVNIAERVRGLVEENARLREALEFYATAENWAEGWNGGKDCIGDRGAAARAALNGSAAT